ncbi:unnamed protein product [Penicillium salamii]|uniref:Protein kinase domain-containing protein n=1 Tax=Penicillium salamii TaxID=1612424 RepID=A0A9W4JDA3_9EURO|nr:unnamed protein product [Penicillium salamii]
MEDIDFTRHARLCPTLKLGDHTITVTNVKRLDQDRTVYRLEIQPVDGLPSTVIVKQQKERWSDEFEKKGACYEKLKDLQGDKIPLFFGQGYFDGIRALVFSKVVGTILLDLARSEKPVDEIKMKEHLAVVFQVLAAREALYWDQKLDNFFYCDDGTLDASKVMVIDLEQVEFPTKFYSWQPSVNKEGPRALMEDLRRARRQYHETCWKYESDRGSEESPRTIDSNVIPLSMDSRSVEAWPHIAA